MQGVTRCVSRAKTGGIQGGLGLAEDKAEASVACRWTGPIAFPTPIKQQDERFSGRISLVFKRLRVVRMVDVKRNTGATAATHPAPQRLRRCNLEVLFGFQANTRDFIGPGPGDHGQRTTARSAFTTGSASPLTFWCAIKS